MMQAAAGLTVEGEAAPAPARSPWRMALRRLLRKRLAVVALAAIVAFYTVGVLAPLIAPHDFRDQDLANVHRSPTWEFPLGTDGSGRDQLSRVIWSARTTIIVTAATVFTGSLVLSVGLGLLSGYAGGKVDTAIMRTGEVFASLPGLPMLILINATMRDRVAGWVETLEDHLSTGEPAFVALLAVLCGLVAVCVAGWLLRGRRAGGWTAAVVLSLLALFALWAVQAVFAMPGAEDYFVIFGALSLFFWVGGARVIRSQVLSLRETEYVLAARSMGAGTWRIIGAHLLPNVSPIIIVGVSASLGAIAGSEIALTFLGVGVHDPTPSFGALIFDASPLPVLRTYPYLLLAPAAVVAVLIFSFNLLGDALNDVLTPRAR